MTINVPVKGSVFMDVIRLIYIKWIMSVSAPDTDSGFDQSQLFSLE